SETMLALELGAVDFVGKPGQDFAGGIESFGDEVRTKVRAAAQSDVRGRAMRASVATAETPVLNAGPVPAGALIAIGASTGGVDAIRNVLSRLPMNCPPIVVTQHMPANFTSRFAERLNQQVALNVVEASDRMVLENGHVYIARGGFQMRLENTLNQLKCRIFEGELVSGHRPSVDVLFTSVAKVVGDKAVGAILTGMGKDGAQGLKKMKQSGAYTVGQNKDSALVYGMPRVAAEIGAVVEEAAVEDIAAKLMAGVMKQKSAA
ncbi:MAG: chemotaxis response regulator protein-glutamate methylesterase, partial [Devosiaceae bacterium]|nr:chemotaxis response regulator protein-glutamate methylesterase [Devosiaceae bacterium]